MNVYRCDLVLCQFMAKLVARISYVVCATGCQTGTISSASLDVISLRRCSRTYTKYVIMFHARAAVNEPSRPDVVFYFLLLLQVQKIK